MLGNRAKDFGQVRHFNSLLPEKNILFITFDRREEAEAMKAEYDGREYEGKKLQVRWAKGTIQYATFDVNTGEGTLSYSDQPPPYKKTYLNKPTNYY